MSNNQDARPFVDLKKDAQEFRVKFDEDIEVCLNYLDAKITNLICDPDSFGASGKSVHQNALSEFSKAKYDIFTSIKSLMNTKEREWLDYIGEMKKLFIENVEIFLAGTKLEVKVPSQESMPSHGPRKSPANRKSNSASVTSSIYPIISSFTKNIPVLGSSRLGVASSSLSRGNVEEEEDDDDDKEVEKLEESLSQSSSIFRRLSNSESKVNHVSATSSLFDLAFGQSSNGTDETTEIPEKGVPLKGHRGRAALKAKTNNMLVFAQNSNENEVLTTEIPEKEVPLKGRRGRTAQKANTNNMTAIAQNSSSADENDVLTTEIPEKEVPLKGRRGRAAQKANTNNVTAIAQNSSSTDENDVLTTEMPEKEVPLKGRRGRTAQKAKTNNITANAQNSSGTDQNEALTTVIAEKEVPLKGRRGRAAQNAKTNNSTAIASKNHTIDESSAPTVVVLENEAPLKGRRGKLAPKAKTNDITVVAHKSSSSEEIEDPLVEVTENEYPVKGRRGKLAVKAEPNDVIGKKTAVRGRKALKPEIEEEIYKAGPSNYKKASFSEEHSSSDELDIQTPLSRPIKTAVRRKTLLPNLEVTSGSDIIPGNPSSSKAKRKTISSIPELESMVPSKRLKGSQKSSYQGNYSKWMSLENVDTNLPNRPAVYEVKVWQAKKPAYIGSCDSLLNKFSLYFLGQRSGNRHLDNFIQRNYEDILMRYEIISSFNDAKQEAENRIENFKAQHKNPPAYN